MKKFKIFALIAAIFTFGISNASALTITEDLVLSDDVNDKVVVDGSKVTIDLNGHNITHAGTWSNKEATIILLNGAEVTVKGTGKIINTGYNGVSVDNGSKFTFNSGTIESVEFGILVAGDSTVTMNGGTINSSDNCGIGGNGSDKAGYKNYTINFNGGTINGSIVSSGYVSCGIYHPNKGTVNVTGGTINSTNGAGIVQRAGTLNITGGTINAAQKTENLKGKVGDSRVVVTASAVVVDKEANYPEVGTISTKISSNAVLNGAAKSIETIGGDVVVELTGGLYNKEPEEGQVPEGYDVYKILAGENEGSYTVVKEDELENVVSDGMLPEDAVTDEEKTKIKNILEDKYDLLGYYDATLLLVTENGDIVDYVSEPSEAVEVTFGLPGDLPELKENYVRKYYVVRIHNGEATIISDVKDNGDGTITFKSDKFSTYAIAYQDVAKTVDTPKTYDGILTYILLLFISIGSIFTIVKITRKNN